MEYYKPRNQKISEVKVMAKKKKKKQKKDQRDYQKVLFNIGEDTSKKTLRKDFSSALNEIQEYRFTLYEIDKLNDKKKRKEINKKQRDFYTQMESIKARKKMMSILNIER